MSKSVVAMDGCKTRPGGLITGGDDTGGLRRFRGPLDRLNVDESFTVGDGVALRLSRGERRRDRSAPTVRVSFGITIFGLFKEARRFGDGRDSSSRSSFLSDRSFIGIREEGWSRLPGNCLPYARRDFKKVSKPGASLALVRGLEIFFQINSKIYSLGLTPRVDATTATVAVVPDIVTAWGRIRDMDTLLAPAG